MEIADIQRALLARYGVRAGRETGGYVLRRLGQRPPQAIPVMAADARTGVPKTLSVDPAVLLPEGAAGHRSSTSLPPHRPNA